MPRGKVDLKRDVSKEEKLGIESKKSYIFWQYFLIAFQNVNTIKLQNSSALKVIKVTSADFVYKHNRYTNNTESHK